MHYHLDILKMKLSGIIGSFYIFACWPTIRLKFYLLQGAQSKIEINHLEAMEAVGVISDKNFVYIVES
jgi:hypothetical protein